MAEVRVESLLKIPGQSLYALFEVITRDPVTWTAAKSQPDPSGNFSCMNAICRSISSRCLADETRQ